MNTPRHITELLDTFTDVWADMAMRRELERREHARRILADRCEKLKHSCAKL